ncbi:unnamed protein product [Discosporangium mesarthrocarpum]
MMVVKGSVGLLLPFLLLASLSVCFSFVVRAPLPRGTGLQARPFMALDMLASQRSWRRVAHRNGRPFHKGDRLPTTPIRHTNADGKTATTTLREIFGDKKGILFGVPGAFTPTCSNNHLPGFIEKTAELEEKGVEVVACVSVNDPFVMKAWGDLLGAPGKVIMLSDGNGDLAAAMGVLVDKSGSGMGNRNQRFMAVVEGGAIKHASISDKGMQSTGVDDALAVL